MHRVGSALLSGAGLMVLLPAVERDVVSSVFRALLTGPANGGRLLLTVAVATSLLIPLTALWMLFRDLTQFYFHANHLQRDASEVFVPRFTLTALQMPADDLSDEAAARLVEARRDSTAVELLVPANPAARKAIDARLATYGLGDVGGAATDLSRAAGLQAMAASRSRTLLEEVAKVEFGMTRHVLRTQSIVLRYVKALLALLSTALAAFAMEAIANGEPVRAGKQSWIACVVLTWAVGVVVAVRAPVAWLDRLLRSEGATRTALGADQDLVQMETVSVRLAVTGFLAALAALVWTLTTERVTPMTRGGTLAIGAAASVALAVSLGTRRARLGA